MDYDRIEFFIARGRSLQVVEAYIAQKRAYEDALTDLVKSVPTASGLLGNHHHVWAFSFKTTPAVPPDGLRYLKRAKAWKPDLRTPAGKRLAEQIAACNKLAPGGLVDRLWPGKFLFGIPTEGDGRGTYVSGVGVEKLGDAWVLRVPIALGKAAAEVPPDAEPLKRSRYWAMKEADGASDAGAA